MSQANNLLIRLPQSLVRSLAIPEFPNLNIYEASYNRYSKKTKGILSQVKAISMINKYIIDAVSKSNKKIHVDLNRTNLKFPQDLIVDYNLMYQLNLKNFDLLSKIIVLPYGTEVHNPTFKDIFQPSGLSRCIRQSMYIRKRIKVDCIYDWAGMITLSDDENYLPWFWKPLKLDVDLYLERIHLVGRFLAERYHFVNEFFNQPNPILIQYSEGISRKPLLNVLNDLNQKSELFRSFLLKNNSKIFIKPHRSDISKLLNRPQFFKGAEIIYADNLEVNYIPSEVFINSGIDNFLLVSEFSTSIFNFQVKNFVAINESKPVQFKHNLMAARRLANTCGFNPYDYYNS